MPDPKQQIVWTAIPRSVKGGEVTVAVFVSPRLGVGSSASRLELHQFSEFEDWPGTLAQKRWELAFGNGQRLAARVDAGRLDSGLWKHLFPRRTFVRPWFFVDRSDAQLNSFDARAVASHLQDAFRTFGRLGGQTLPSRDEPDHVGPLIEDLSKVRDPMSEMGGLLETRMEAGALPPGYRVPAERAFGQREFDLYRVIRFYERPEEQAGKYRGAADASRVPPGELARKMDAPPELDFHQIVGALADYPELLLRLGLVVDLTCEAPEGEPKTVDVIPDPRGAEDILPHTRCRLTSRTFLASPASQNLRNGMIDLRGAGKEIDPADSAAPRFDLLQVDVDGGALKLVNAAAVLQELRKRYEGGPPPLDGDESASLPTLRGGGVTVVQVDRAATVAAALDGAATLDAQASPAAPPDLDAEDIVRGYRVEVEAEGVWYSLHRRVGEYRLVDDNGDPIGYVVAEQNGTTDNRREGQIADEGYSKGPSTTSKPSNDADLYLHEALVRWTGWSLSAPRPGRPAVPVPGETTRDGATVPTQGEEVAAAANKAGPGIRLETRFVPQPGTLPRLRYGAGYRVRMTWVDLSGRAALEKPPAAAPASEAVRFMRYEPVEPPPLVPRYAFTEGESLERLVIRSTFDASVKDYFHTTLDRARDHETHPLRPFHEACERHLAAPKGSEQLAELHGKLDKSFGPSGDPRWAFRISLKEGGSFRDEKIVDVDTVDPGDPKPTISAGEVHQIAVGAVGAHVAEPDDPDGYVVNHSPRLVLPYLPDPAAAGVAIRGLPGVELGATIPGCAIREVPLDDRAALLIPWTPNGNDHWPESAPLRLRLEEVPAHASGPLAPAWDPEARALTVYLDKAGVLEVEYSSFLYPNVLGTDAVKEPGLMGVLAWLRKDAHDDKLQKQAEAGAHWMLSPTRRLTLVHAVQRPLHAAGFQQDLTPSRAAGWTRAELRGTISLSGISTGRLDVLASWKEWVDDADPKNPPVQVVHADIPVFHRNREEAWDEGKISVEPPNATQEFGDTKYRHVSYRVRAATRFPEYFPPSVTDDASNLWRDDGPVVERDVRSTANPDAPAVLYVIPTFGWQQSESDGEVDARERSGGGLRVYLNRPWYSSGDGELLAVVLGRDVGMGELDPNITRIGVDPAWRAATPPLLLKPEHFRGQAITHPLPDFPILREVPNREVEVAAYAPQYDSGRDLWYCDIQVDMRRLPGYWPFIRLALARYQPMSIDPQHELSKIVVAEFSQLAPDRSMSLIRDRGWINIMVRGQGSRHEPLNPMEFLLQRTDADDPDELAWSTVEVGNPATDPAYVNPKLDDFELIWERRMKPPAGDGPLRLAVREYEVLPTDPGTLGSGQGPATNYDNHIARIVYADAVRLR